MILLLVAVQVTLGALTVLTKRDIWINSVHLVCGALVLATSIVITLRSWHVRIDAKVQLEPDTTSVIVGDVRSVRLQADHVVRLQPDPDVRLQADQGSRT
jgi:heme A synthase